MSMGAVGSHAVHLGGDRNLCSATCLHWPHCLSTKVLRAENLRSGKVGSEWIEKSLSANGPFDSSLRSRAYTKMFVSRKIPATPLIEIFSLPSTARWLEIGRKRPRP